ncbi:MAG: hypothetical protein COA36_08880 [Desulfotalea sp.]|nr:MAG: hypothetical protein COA36_08880 [Desulfotalea sp.]
MRIMFVGDLNLGEYYPSFGHGPGTFANTSYIFANVQSIFDRADFVIGNLEAPITSRNIHKSEVERTVLKVQPAHAYQLKNAGFGLLQVSNNHMLQHSDEGFDDSLKTLTHLGISAIGLNNSPPVMLEQNGLRIGILAASDVPDNTNKQQTKYQCLDESFIERVKSEVTNFDHLIVLLHWGLEASTSPLLYQRQIADSFYQAGVSAVVGNHPHLFYEIEKRDNFICAYSLGNFVFDLCWDKRMVKTGILDLKLSKNNIYGKFWPIEIKKNGCLPTPSGEPEDINKTLIHYNLRKKMRFQQIRKSIYLILNLCRGNSLLKIKFIIEKLSRRS